MHPHQLFQFGLGLLIPPLAMVAGLYGSTLVMTYLMIRELRRMHRAGANFLKEVRPLSSGLPRILYGVCFTVALVTLCAIAMWWAGDTLILWGAFSSLAGLGLFAALKGAPPPRTGPFIVGVELSQGRWADMLSWIKGTLETWRWFAAPFRPPPPDPEPIPFGPNGFQEAFTAELLRAVGTDPEMDLDHGELIVLVETTQLGVATFTIREDPPVPEAVRTAALAAFAQFAEAPNAVSCNLYVLRY